MRLGIDLGGTKVEAVILGDDGSIIWRERQSTPRHDYRSIIATLNTLISNGKAETGFDGPVGMGIPGSIHPQTGLVRGANTQVLNGQNLKADCEAATGRPFMIENDANCFVLSEAVDGAAAGHETVFGVILGTGCGGGIVAHGKPLSGGNNLAGEWGHTPLPWPLETEYDGHECWCGQTGCLETFLSGTAVSADYETRTGEKIGVEEIAARTATDLVAESVLQVLEDRLARALGQIISFIDPDAIVLGGGLSNLDRLYTAVPRKWNRYVFTNDAQTPLLKPAYGDSSGVRGAAWLWPDAGP
ncbi:MAG: ROK family protein [Candidatus Puniceispirillales bacterium]